MNSTSYSRYLEAKKSVDERAINQRVWGRFVEILQSYSASKKIELLDIGIGTGQTLFRILGAIRFERIVYTALDVQKEHIETLQVNLKKWVNEEHGTLLEQDEEYLIHLPDGREIRIQFVVDGIINFLESREKQPIYDAVIAQAIMDLLDMEKLFPLLMRVMNKGGLYYFPINYDGLTTFLPPCDSVLDRKIEQIYNDSMLRDGVNRSHTGRNLLMYLLKSGVKIVEAGSSDWVVHPGEDRNYPGDEDYFLRHILYFVQSELMRSSSVDQVTAANWISSREKQIEDGELVYIAHQLDILAANQ